MLPLVALALVALAGVGCERATVEGVVIDERGDRLPGVAITVEGTRDQALSNALGEYRVQFRPRGNHLLQFRKTGFTPGILELEVLGPRTVSARTVELWRVPPYAGVFLVERYRFEATTPVEVTPFGIVDEETAYGTQRDPEYTSTNPYPVIILHRVSPFDVWLARLEERPTTEQSKAWVLAETIATNLAALDQPEGVLQQLKYQGALEPGVYAVHWGALFGSTQNEARIFTFRIATPEELDELEAADEDLNDQPDIE
jgi:hypothetical protein